MKSLIFFLFISEVSFAAVPLVITQVYQDEHETQCEDLVHKPLSQNMTIQAKIKYVKLCFPTSFLSEFSNGLWFYGDD